MAPPIRPSKLISQNSRVAGARRRPARSSVVAASVLCFGLLALGPAAAPARAQASFVSQSFKGSSAPGWVLGGTAVLTSGNPDPAGDGWLRLTKNTTYQAGYAYYNTPIPTGRGLVVTFDYAAWGGNGADGLTFFLFDGTTTTFNVGASGGSLGYAQKTGVKGLSNGYLGLGLDEFGNYSNPNEGRVGGPGFIPQAVAIRGPGNGTTGYAYLAGTKDITTLTPALPRLDHYPRGTCGSTMTRPVATTYYRQVRITVTPVGAAYAVLVEMRFSTSGPWFKLFGPFTMPTSAPGTLKMGFAASTGGSCNYHEICNLNVSPEVPDLTATKAVQNVTTGGGSVEPGQVLLYTVVLKNNTGADIAGVGFLDPIPDYATYLANSVTASSGTASYNGQTPAVQVTGMTVPANGQATVTFRVQVDASLPAEATTIGNQGAYTYGSTTAYTDGDSVTAGDQPTVIPVTAGPNFDASTKTVSVFTDTAPVGDVSPGDTLLYHVVLPNTGNQNSPTTTFTDALPSKTTYVTGSATASGGTVSYNSTTKTITWTVAVNAGSQATLDFKVTVNSGVQIRDVISNQGTTTYGTTSVLTDADLATPGKQPTVLLAGGQATLTANKSASLLSPPLQPGGQVEYTVLLKNTGTYAVSGATFVDTIPANATYVPGSATTSSGTATYSQATRTLNVTGIALASGATATIVFRVQVDNPLPAGVTQIGNQGVANWDSNQSGNNNASLQTDSDPATAGQQPTVNVIPNADLTVTKAVDASSPAEGDTIAYTLHVTNNGPNDATDAVVTDPLPAGLTYVSFTATQGNYTSPTWNVGTLPSGASATLTIRATVNLGQGGKTIGNTANASSARYDAYPANNSANASLTVKTTTLSGKVTDAVTGEPLEGVTVQVAGTSCTSTTGPDGTYAVTSGLDACLLAPGAATVAATAAPAGYILTSTSVTIVAGAANVQDLALVQPSLNGVVTDLGTGVPLVGATVTLTQGSTTCTTTTGPGGAYNFVAGSACSFAAGAATITVSQTHYQDASESPTILATGPTTQNLALGTADLLITKTDSQTVAQPGETLTYVIKVVNNGSIAADAVTLKDILPPYLTYVSDDSGLTPVESPAGTWTWSLGSLAKDASKTFTLKAVVAASLPDGETRLANYARVDSSSPEKDTTNNEVSDVDTVNTHPDLRIAKSFTSTPPAGTGSTASYQLTGGNAGHATATGVTVVDTLDALVTYVAGSASLKINGNIASFTSVSYDTGTHKLTLVLPDLAPTHTYEITYTGTVGTVTGSPLANVAAITGIESDLNTANNTASVSVPTARNVDVYVLKSAVANSNPAAPGAQIAYALSYGNNGIDPGTDVQIVDALPANTTLVPGSITGGGSYDNGTRTITWSLGSLASKTSGTVHFAITIDDPLPAGLGAIENTATISTSATDAVPGNNSSTTSTAVTAQPDFVITKTDGTTQVLAGDTLTYTITYRNVGNQTASGVTIVDELLNGVDYVTSDPPGTYDSETGTVTWIIGDLADFVEHTITLTLKVKSDALPSSVAADRVTIADDGANGSDPNPANNTATDSDLVTAPYIVIEKHATVPSGNPAGVAYTGQQITYTIDWHNTGAATANSVVIQDTLPAGSTVVAGSVSAPGTESGGVIAWDLGNQAAGASGTVSFTVTVNVGAGGATQTTPTLSTEAGSGSVTVVSSTTPLSLPGCELGACAAFKCLYQGENGAPPLGWNDNPRLTAFDDTGWTAPIAASTAELSYWMSAADLAAEWVAPNTDGHLEGNFTFFRQALCLPLNATGISATLELAGDDVSDIYLNGVYLGQEVGAGGADSFDATPGIQSGINVLAVQLLNNRHGGHPFPPPDTGKDHIGLLFNLRATYTGLRPFVSAPSHVKSGETVTFAVDELALGGRQPYDYTISHDGGATWAPYQSGATFTHTYTSPGTYTAVVKARAAYGCTGTDQVVVTVLSSTSQLLANPATVAYADANGKGFNRQSGAGLDLGLAADLEIEKTVVTGGTTPGATVQYQLAVRNNGPDVVTGAVVTDAVPPAVTGVTWICSFTGGASGNASGSGNALSQTVDLPAGATATYTIIGTIHSAATGTLENTATLAPPTGVTDLVADNNLSTVSTTLTPSVDLTVSKTSSPNPGLPPGGSVTYTIVVSNGGPSDAVGVTVVDTFPVALTDVTWTGAASTGSACTASGSGNIDDPATIAAGGSVTYTVRATVAAAAEIGTAIENTATATYGGTPAQATDSNTLVAMTSLTATKDVLNSESASSRTLPFIDADASGGISPGDTLLYSVIVHNPSTDTAAYHVAYHDIPDANTALVVGTVTCDAGTVLIGNTPGDTAVSVSIPSIPPSGSVTISYRVTVHAALPFQLAALNNQGQVSGSNVPSLATDDPATTAVAGDPTIVTLTLGAISGVTWRDDDNDGVMDTGEPMVPNIPVTLYFAGADGIPDNADDQTAYGVSDQTGAYRFSSLASGSYKIGFSLPDGFAFSQYYGTGLDSKPDPATGVTGQLIIEDLGSNREEPGISAGLVSQADFGNLPSQYRSTTLAEDGARHVKGGLYLGPTILIENDGAEGTPADNDGVTWVGQTWRPDQTVTLTVRVGGTGRGNLWAWFDWNNDADLDDPGEAVNLGTLTVGTADISLEIPPSWAANSPLYARFRLYPEDYAQEFTPYGVVSGGEVEDYTIEPTPTAARLAYFHAIKTGVGQTTLVWETLVEVNMLGFKVDRSNPDGGWLRITPRLIAAQGSDPRLHRYELVDAAAPSQTGLRYRLVGVDVRGAECPLAEALLADALTVGAQWTTDGLRIQVSGPAETQIAIETATNVVQGPWSPVHHLRLDDAGTAAVTLPLQDNDPERFFRLRQE